MFASQFDNTYWYYIMPSDAALTFFVPYYFPHTNIQIQNLENMRQNQRFIPQIRNENYIKQSENQQHIQIRSIQERCKDEAPDFIINKKEFKNERREKKRRYKKNQLQKILNNEYDRNITSNLFKIYLRYVGQDLKLQQGTHSKIIDSFKDKSFDQNGFKNDLENILNPKMSYIRLDKVKQICKNAQQQYHILLCKTLRISLKIFLKKTIFLINSSEQFRKPIKNIHIRAASRIFTDLFS